MQCLQSYNGSQQDYKIIETQVIFQFSPLILRLTDVSLSCILYLRAIVFGESEMIMELIILASGSDYSMSIQLSHRQDENYSQQ